MKISRRNFLKGSVTTLFLAGFNLPVYSNSKKKNLVVIMLRGGMDGLCAVPVIGDKDFEKRRKNLILDKTIKLNSDFALHPRLTNFHKLWKKEMGTIIHATNIPYTQRSHFDGQNLMETGGRVPYEIKTGWLGRTMKLAKLQGDGLALSLPMPLLLRGVPKNDNYYPAKGIMPRKEILEILRSVYLDKSEEELLNMMEIIKQRSTISSEYESRDNSALALKAGQELNKLEGPRVAVFEIDGFDTHAAQGGIDGSHSDCLIDMDKIFLNLEKGLGKELNNTLIVTLTEFGRTIKQNSGLGTEHGYGSAIFMGGGLLKKSQVFTDWPGLKRKQLFEQRDLNSTIDSRSIYASAMSTVFEVDFERIRKEVFWAEDLKNYSDKLFKT
tara:strand:+ start:1429 stop:2577 length:1149 start_codon:yes stop_codon:yes gene_type:complete